MADAPDLQVMSPSAATADEPMALDDAPQPTTASQQSQFRQASPRSPPVAMMPPDTSVRSEPYPIAPGSPPVRDQLALALQRATEEPIPDTTPPEERHQREANLLRQQLISTRHEASVALQVQS